MKAYPYMAGVPAAGHVTSGGHWHPGQISGCTKCEPRRTTAQRVRITEVERLDNSYNGNPRFRVYWHSAQERGSAVTATDSSYSYEVGERGMRAGDWVLITLNGRGTIDRIEATR